MKDEAVKDGPTRRRALARGTATGRRRLWRVLGRPWVVASVGVALLVGGAQASAACGLWGSEPDGGAGPAGATWAGDGDTARTSHRHPGHGRPWRGRPTSGPAPSTTAPSDPAPSTSPTTISATSTTVTSTTEPGSPPSSAALVEDWAGPSSLFRSVTHDGSTVEPGRSDPSATDGRSVALTLPAGADPSPAHAAEVESIDAYTYGSFTSRVRSADCSAQPRTGAVTGIFTFGKPGGDVDGDGVTDNSELDVEILCARPWELSLSIWTDFDEATNAQSRVTRVVDLRAGTILSTCFQTGFDTPCGAVSPAESAPDAVPAVAGFDSVADYHDYRIDWSADRVVFSVEVDGRYVPLWDYRGPSERIPHLASQYMVNVWHTDDWTPDGLEQAVNSPTSPLTVTVDTSTITPASS